MTSKLIDKKKHLQTEKLTLGLMLTCLGVSVASFWYLVGDIGFQGDDWWIFGIPFWNSFPESLLIYAKESRRPIEGLYWIGMYEVFGLHSPAFLAGSVILLSLSCLLMTSSLLNAFPGYRCWAVFSGLLAFVITPMANLVYMLHTDNSRISCFFFWVSVLLFQNWAKDPVKTYKLLSPILFFCLATLTYENCALLIFAVPFLTFPVFRLHGSKISTIKFLVIHGVSVIVGFLAFLVIRFLIFGGGAVGHKSLTPPLDLVFSYLAILTEYILYPLKNIDPNTGNIFWATLVTVSGFLLWIVSRDRIQANKASPVGLSNRLSLILASLSSFSILGCGLAPYLLAGYGPEPGFTSQSRIFSSAGFGVAAIICLPLVFLQTRRRLFGFAKICLLALIFLNALSLVALRSDWIKAKVYRDNITSSLIANVPGVERETNFLFLDLQWYLSNKAVVFQGVDGLNEWIKIVYNSRKVNGYFLYPADGDHEEKEKEAIITLKGLLARGSAMQGPLALDSLILLKRKGDRLEILKNISKEDGAIFARWQEIKSIHTNFDLISKR